MLDKMMLADIIQYAINRGADFAEVYVEDKQASNIFCEDDKIEKIHSGREKGAGIRVVKDGNTSYVYTNDLSEKGLFSAVQVAAGTVVESAAAGERVLSLVHKEPAFQIACQRLPQAVSIEEKIQHVLAANQAARDVSAHIRQVTVAAADVFKRVQIANSLGEIIEDEKSRVRLLVNTVAAKDGIIQTGYESAGGVCGWELLDHVSFTDMAFKAAELSMHMLTARPAPAGKMPVIMSCEAGGTMVHEACGHGLEADLVHRGLSVYQNRLGKQVAATGVSVIDDATIGSRYGTFSFDDEGITGQKTVLIENGILAGYMYDRLTAWKDGKESTGNGRRESYQHKPIVRMSNTFIAPGRDDPDEIIRSTPFGLLVKKMGGGQVNTTNGDFVFDVQEGYIVEDGKLKYPVRGATLSGNGPRALMNIEHIGNDLGFGIGVCGKDGQGVPVADAQPTIKIKELIVGGTAARESSR